MLRRCSSGTLEVLPLLVCAHRQKGAARLSQVLRGSSSLHLSSVSVANPWRVAKSVSITMFWEPLECRLAFVKKMVPENGHLWCPLCSPPSLTVLTKHQHRQEQQPALLPSTPAHSSLPSPPELLESHRPRESSAGASHQPAPSSGSPH